MRVGLDGPVTRDTKRRAFNAIKSGELRAACAGCLRHRAVPGGSERPRMLALHDKIRGELMRRRRTTTRLARAAYKEEVELYNECIGAYIKRMMGTHRGGGGAAAERGAEGEVLAATTEEALESIRAEYGAWFQNDTAHVVLLSHRNSPPPRVARARAAVPVHRPFSFFALRHDAHTAI